MGSYLDFSPRGYLPNLACADLADDVQLFATQVHRSITDTERQIIAAAFEPFVASFGRDGWLFSFAVKGAADASASSER